MRNSVQETSMEGYICFGKKAYWQQIYFFKSKTKAGELWGGEHINSGNWKIELGFAGSRGSSSVVFILRRAPGYVPPARQSQLKKSFQQIFLVCKKARMVVDSVSMEIFKHSLDSGEDGLFVVPEGCCMIQVTLGSLLNFVVSHQVHDEGVLVICWYIVIEKEGEE